MMRTQYCGLVDEQLIDQTITICGWVHRRRDHGGVIFLDMRDREGLLQVVVTPIRPKHSPPPMLRVLNTCLPSQGVCAVAMQAPKIPT